jgi:predicted nuclease of predicted toxin-antitoxin system
VAGRFKLDENIPRQAVGFLVEHGHDVETVAGEDLVGAADRDVAAAATAERRMVLTTDRGFADIRRYVPGTHSGIVVVHARELRASIIHTLHRTFIVDHRIDDFTGCNVVVQPGSVRVRRPDT